MLLHQSSTEKNFFLLLKDLNKWPHKLKPFLVIVLTNVLHKLNFVPIALKSSFNMRHKYVLEIWSSSERLLTDCWIMSDVLTHKFDVVNASSCSRTTRVLSIRNCPKYHKCCDNKANTARRGIIFISSILSECSLCSYNGTVALNSKLNN